MKTQVSAEKPASEDFCSSMALITPTEAQAHAVGFASLITDTEIVPLWTAAGRTAARDIHARIAIPPFPQSAMDGYALNAGDGLEQGASLKVVSRVAAGYAAGAVARGEAVRIFTGAPIPKDANAVIMQEHVRREADVITLTKPLRPGDNVRYKGEDIDPPIILLATFSRLDARHVGLLSAQGFLDVEVLRKPRIAVISTGDELRPSGQPLDEATIYDSNRPMLLSMIAQAGYEAIDGGWLPDNPGAIRSRLSEIGDSVDLIVTTGGVSVGEEDHISAAVTPAIGCLKELKIALKPGKPAMVGRIGRAAYLGLPGNPVACWITWMVLGMPMVAAVQGRQVMRRSGYRVETISAFKRRPGRCEFVPARLCGSAEVARVEILG